MLVGESIPSLGSPAVPRPLRFKNDVLPPKLGQMITHGKTGLAAAYDCRFDAFSHRSSLMDQEPAAIAG